ncbi:MAG TPA: xanthine dehydrogenase family protein molybdopterin-binding subunit [Solirubrobacter sp.]|nr:xanthine dehydrogenase family protein molybdopterin-binding subunit [Solirubrobacter sp.]
MSAGVGVPKLVGASVKRKEDPRLLQGGGRYVADLKRVGLLHAAVLRSPVAHASIRVNVDAVRADPRTRLVLTAADLPEGMPPLPCIDAMPDTKPANQPLLARDVVRFVGEPIAVVVAESRAVAEDLLELIELDFDERPAVVNPEAAMSDGAPILHEDWGTNVGNELTHQVGDVDAAFAAAAHIFERRLKIHRYHGMPLETRGVLADWDPAREHLTVWSSTQFPHALKQFVTGMLGLAPHQVRIVAPDVGGGFGVKCEFYPEDILLSLASRALGRPVKWIEDRYEHFVSASHAREQIHDVQVAVDANGVITGLRDRIITNNGAYLHTLAITPSSIASAMVPGPYRIPNYACTALTVVTNKVPLSVYRGAGHPQAVFVMERMMDVIARELGIDPAELRYRNFLQPDELPFDRGTEIVLAGKVVYDSGNYPECLRRALEMVGYEAFREEQARARAEGRCLGLGMAIYVEETAIGPYESATVRIEPSGHIVVYTGASPHGQGHETAFAQVVADQFGVGLDDVTVLHGDTDLMQYGVGTYASRSAPVGGSAMNKAAVVVREKAQRLAAHMLEADPEDMVTSEGRVHVVGDPARGFSLAELATAAMPGSPLPDGMTHELQATEYFDVPGIAFAYATHVAVVEVDPETGVVTPQRYCVVHDSGTLINPLIVEGQVQGGVVQGLGGTLLEELMYDEDGQPLNPNFVDYLMPAVGNVPTIEVGHMETPTPLNPMGMKGAGEGGAVGSPAALVNAVEDAVAHLGVRVMSSPVTPNGLYDLIAPARR